MAINHLADIRNGSVDRSNIRGIRMALNAAWRIDRGYSTSATTRHTAPLADEMLQAIHTHQPRVIGALHDSGLNVLRAPRWRKRFSDSQRATIAGDRLHFALVDWIDVHRGAFVPVYEARSTAGAFRFSNIPWQTASAYGLESGPQVTE